MFRPKVVDFAELLRCLFFQYALIITTGRWTGSPEAWTKTAAAVRKQATVYSLGVRPGAQEPELQQVTQNNKNVFMVGSYNLLGNYWRTLRTRLEQGMKRLPLGFLKMSSCLKICMWVLISFMIVVAVI